MNRRGFLKILAGSALLAKTLSISAGIELTKLDPELIDYFVTYDMFDDLTVFRVSYKMPDGSEWHDALQFNRDCTDDINHMWSIHQDLMRERLEKANA